MQESKIHFHIRLDESSRFYDRAFDIYDVHPDGVLYAYPISTGEYASGIGKFDWYWDGEKIIQKNLKTGETVKVFSLKP